MKCRGYSVLSPNLKGAFAFLTIVPLAYPQLEKPGRIFTYFPLVGLFIGGVVALVAANPWLSPGLTSFLTLLVWVVLTGGLHLDGFGDACDGLLAAVEPERRLEIMKDSRAGSWAVIGLILLLLGKWVALHELIQVGANPLWLILPPVVARWVVVIITYHFPYGRASGIGGFFREGLGRPQVVIATLLTLVIVIGIAIQSSGLLLCLPVIALAVSLIVGRWAAGRLGGGLTGDIYGAVCELIEWVSLLVLGAMMYG